MSYQHATPSHSLAPRICIIGGGFGGLYTALYLQKYRHLRRSQIVLIEPKERFLFTPMMYELITDELKDWEVAPTYSSLLAGKNVVWKQVRADSIDLEQQRVIAAGNSIGYDYLVVATGAESRSVDIRGVAQHSLTFRSLEDALTLKSRLALLVQAQKHQPASTPAQIVVVGGGPSGVELSAKVNDYLVRCGLQNVRITLIERGEQILAPFEQKLRKLASRSLSHRQIDVMTKTDVVAVEADSVIVEDRQRRKKVLRSQLTLWAVGTQPRPWIGKQPVPTNEQGQKLTRRSLQLLDYDNVFVLGDGAIAQPKNSDRQPAPNTAQAAYQAANQVTKNLSAIAQGRQPKAFKYLHLGNMLTLGIGDAGVWSFGIAVSGRLAAVCRRGIYILRMPTRRHQLKVARRALGELARAVFIRF